MMVTQYAVALIFPDDVSFRLDVLRQDYLRYVNYSIQPHITLVYPFTPEADIALINEKLRLVADRIKPFTLILDGIEFFEGKNNVAYVAIANKQPVTDLHYSLNHSIDRLIADEFRGRFNLHNFIPHVTIGEQIPDHVFANIKDSLSGMKIHYEIEIASFTLFSGGDDGNWKPSRVFEFSKT